MTEVSLAWNSEVMGVYLLILSLAYLIGAIPLGLWLARLFHLRDIRLKKGGNMGGLEISPVVGFWPLGVLTIVLDGLKGMLAVFLASDTGAQIISGALGMGGGSPIRSGVSFLWCAAFCVSLGHSYSPFLSFKGGKAVATAFGSTILLSPISAFAGALGFFVSFFNKRLVALASITGLLTASIAYLIFNPFGVHLFIGAALIFLLLMRHEKNMDSFLEDAEKL